MDRQLNGLLVQKKMKQMNNKTYIFLISIPIFDEDEVIKLSFDNFPTLKRVKEVIQENISNEEERKEALSYISEIYLPIWDNFSSVAEVTGIGGFGSIGSNRMWGIEKMEVFNSSPQKEKMTLLRKFISWVLNIKSSIF